jgi:hypothetical protein
VPYWHPYIGKYTKRFEIADFMYREKVAAAQS